MIRQYLSDIINNHKTSKDLRVHLINEVIDYETQFGEGKILLIMSISFISFKNSDEARIMITKNDNVEVMIGSETDYIIEDLFQCVLQKYQQGLEESMRRGSGSIFDSVDLLHYYLLKTSLIRKGASYIDSPEWLKNKKATINPKNNDNCFQYALTAAVIFENIKSHPERVSNLKPFIDQYNWKETDFPTCSKDWKKFELDKKSIALSILFVPHNIKEIRHAYK